MWTAPKKIGKYSGPKVRKKINFTIWSNFMICNFSICWKRNGVNTGIVCEKNMKPIWCLFKDSQKIHWRTKLLMNNWKHWIITTNQQVILYKVFLVWQLTKWARKFKQSRPKTSLNEINQLHGNFLLFDIFIFFDIFDFTRLFTTNLLNFLVRYDWVPKLSHLQKKKL